MREGAWMTEAHHEHVPTETGPGHAALATGLPPSGHGIVGNDWYDRRSGAEVYCVADSAHGKGPENLEAYTLGDALKAAIPEAKVVAVSVKDRAAILPAGHRGDVALWMDKKSGEFTSSSYYRRPDWLAKFNEKRVAPWLKTVGKDERVRTDKADALTLELALEAVSREKLGKDEAPDLLSVSLSALDYVGHHYGSETPQYAAHLAFLDGAIGGFLDALEKKVGKGRVSLAFSADHGSPPGQGPTRINIEELGKTIERALQDDMRAKSPWVVSNLHPHFYFNRAQAEAHGIPWKDFLVRVAQIVRKIPGVGSVHVPESPDPKDALAARVEMSLYPGRSGDLVVSVAEGAMIVWEKQGSDHGSPHRDDTHVPLIFWGAEFKPGRFARRVRAGDLAPTSAAALGLSMPQVQPRAIAEVLAAPEPAAAQ